MSPFSKLNYSQILGQLQYNNSATPISSTNKVVEVKNTNTAVAVNDSSIDSANALNIIPPSDPINKHINLLHIQRFNLFSSPTKMLIKRSANIPTDIPNIIQNKITGVIDIVSNPTSSANIAPKITLIKILRQQFPNIFLPPLIYYIQGEI